MQANEFRIKEFTNPSGKTVFRVFGTLDGKEVRKNRKTMGEAVTLKQELEREALNLAPLPGTMANLTPEQAREAEACFFRLRGQAFGLSAAVEFAIKNFSPAGKNLTIADALAETGPYVTTKRNEEASELHIRSMRARLKKLAAALGKSTIAEVQPEQLRPLIFRDGSGILNRISDYRAFTNFFNWAVKAEYCVKSPMAKIEKLEAPEPEPEIMDLAACRKIVTAAYGFQEGKLLPYVALALFCGIRPTEISRLTWEDVDLEDRTVTISAKFAKMRQRRIVAISENAVAMLVNHVVRRTPFVGANWRNDFDAVKREAGYAPDLIPWTMDILRHTAISMHLAQWEHEGKTAAWAGNSPDIVQKHYKGLVKKKAAAEFWSIAPAANIIQLQAA